MQRAVTDTLGRSTATRQREQPARRRNRRVLRLFAIDSLLFATFVVVVNVPLTGLAVHEWLGIAIGIGLIVHLVQHGDWIATTSHRMLSATSFQNRLNYFLMLSLFAGFVSIIASGLLISEVALPWIGVTPNAGPFWLWLHLVSVGWVIWLTAIHVALNWRWIAGTMDRLVFRPLERHRSSR